MPNRRKHALTVSVIFDVEKYHVSTNYFFNTGKELVDIDRYSTNLDLRNFMFKYFVKHILFWKIYYFCHRKFMPIVFYLTRNDMTIREKFVRLNFSKLKNYFKS